MLETLLTQIGKRVPNRRYVRAIPNLVLKPIHAKLCDPKPVVRDVLGFRMELDPTETVDSGLFFAPQLYDSEELAFLERVFPADGKFVDVGSNIGFWALYFAYRFPKSSALAIEANPNTSRVLDKNIELNGFEARVHSRNVGVSDEPGELPLYLNTNGNRGGDSFVPVSSERAAVSVPVETLASVTRDAGFERIDIIKLDIEGFEERVLAHYFDVTEPTSWPSYICAETIHLPGLVSMLLERGYREVLSAKENSVFELIRNEA